MFPQENSIFCGTNRTFLDLKGYESYITHNLKFTCKKQIYSLSSYKVLHLRATCLLPYLLRTTHSGFSNQVEQFYTSARRFSFQETFSLKHTQVIPRLQKKASLYSRQSVVPRQRTISGRCLRKMTGSAPTYWH